MYLDIRTCEKLQIEHKWDRKCKEIPGFSGCYVTDDGYVFSARREVIRLLTKRRNPRARHWGVFVRSDTGNVIHLLIWRLVADAFLFYADQKERVLIRYLDGDALNCSKNNLHVTLPYWLNKRYQKQLWKGARLVYSLGAEHAISVACDETLSVFRRHCGLQAMEAMQVVWGMEDPDDFTALYDHWCYAKSMYHSNTGWAWFDAKFEQMSIWMMATKQTEV